MIVLKNYKCLFCQHGQQLAFHMLASSSVFRQETNHDTFPQVRINVPLWDFSIITKREMYLGRKHLKNPSKIPFSLPLLSVPGQKLGEAEKYVATPSLFWGEENKQANKNIKDTSPTIQFY